MNWSRLYIAALAGALGALVVDIQSFQAWAAANDGTSFNWKLAASRVLQGAAAGALSGLGLNSVGA